MSRIASAASWILFAFLGALAAIIAARLLSGEMNIAGLLRRKGGTDKVDASPERVQLLLSTIAMAGTYMNQLLRHASSGQLPDIPDSWLGALGASHVLYMGTKLWSARSTKSESP